MHIIGVLQGQLSFSTMVQLSQLNSEAQLSNLHDYVTKRNHLLVSSLLL